MKTLGEILKNARLEENLTLEKVSAITRIETKYLKALENNQYNLLPAATFTKGFIRNYAQVIDRDPKELIAIYRRDFSTTNKPMPTSKTSQTINRPLLHSFSKSTLILFFAGFLTFFGYLGFQYRALLIPPPLNISQPQQNAVVTSPVSIEGKTSPDSIITINEDTDLSPGQNGVFLTQITLSPGEHRLKITAVNRFGRTAQKDLTITVLSSD